MKLTIALWITTLSVAVGQQHPASPCEFDGFDTNSKLAETIKTGDPVVVNRVEGDWTCGYLVTRKGASQGWVQSKDIHLVNFDTNPAPIAWTGTWVQDENRIQIQNSKIPGKLTLTGEAYWHGRGDNVNSGEISREADPIGNHLHLRRRRLQDRPRADRQIKMLANDNNRCGGMNVRFWGIWKRAHLQDPLK